MPVLPAIQIGLGLLGLAGSNKASKEANRNRRTAQAQVADQVASQREALDALEAQRQQYMDFKFQNPYSGMANPFAGMENPFEDLTVNQQTARFQAEQGAQQRANIMQGLRGAAGASGVASLAQALANQGVLQTRQASADIAQQEAQNQRLAAQGAMQIDQMRRKGELEVDLVRRQGQQMVQEAEMRRQSTLLGMAFQGAAGAATGLQSAYANQMSAGATAAQLGSNMAGAAFGMLGQTAGMTNSIINK